MSQNQLTMYTTPWCGDCKRVKMFLSQNDVDFREIDISNDEGAAKKVEEINGGFRSVPTLLFPDGTIQTEPSNSELQTALERNGLMLAD